MFFLILAELIVLIHFAFVVFVVLGGLLSLKWSRAMYVHIPAALWGAIIEFQGWVCPLTPWEQQLRRLAGGEGYSGDFIAYYLLPVLYPGSLTREIQVLLGLLVIAINLVIYSWLLMKSRRDRV